jgi:hypothetical protein
MGTDAYEIEGLANGCSMTIPRSCQAFHAFVPNLPQIARINTGIKSGQRMYFSDLTVARWVAVAAWVGAGCGLAGPTTAQIAAQTYGSLYTSTAPKDCRVTSGGIPGNEISMRVCPGKARLVVRINEGDLRETVSVGRNAAVAGKEPASQSGFGPFNSTTDTVEWRAIDSKPFAIIQRWHLADISAEDKDGRPTDRGLLVVTRLPPGAVCHVAYIDVKANPNANELARKAADDNARDFKCGKDDVKMIGERGRAAELAMPR